MDTALNDESSTINDAMAQLEAEQGKRFLELSKRCHEQNWVQVHAIAEQIVLHKRRLDEEKKRIADDKKTAEGDAATNVAVATENNEEGSGIEEGQKDHSSVNIDCSSLQAQSKGYGSISIPLGSSIRRALREGTVSISGEVTRNNSISDADIYNVASMNVEGFGGGDMQQILVPTAGGELDYNNVDIDTNNNNAELDNNHNNNANAGNTTEHDTPQAAPQPLVVNKPSPATPRMLSTCLGTASPLAWTCRYSAPSSTVKLVLGLDLSAVRRCLPQLGTPLHECVGRPRPLRTMPMKKGRWSNLLGNVEGVKTLTADVPSKKIRGKKKKKRKRTCPRLLTGLREWRRTVRTLIQADETLLKEDVKLLAALKASEKEATGSGEENANRVNTEEWRRTVHTMIKDNVTNLNNLKRIESGEHAATLDKMEEEKGDESTSSNEVVQPKQLPTIRATLGQDADGNTPLHFMIRGAAAPALGGGRWQSRHEVEDEEYSDDDDDDESSNDGECEGAMSLDDSDKDIDRDLRHIEYRGRSGSSWDGVRWCMEAHLRRVERRVARQLRRREKQEDVDERVAKLAAVRLDREDRCDEQMLDLEEDDRKPAAASVKLPIKRRSKEDDKEGRVKARRRGSLQQSPIIPKDAESSKSNRKRRTKTKRKTKYLDEDECQDCCYDPLLGAVKDLVHSCPEAVGIPDHREYEETPLIVALKSSIYVVMEPDHDFQLADGGLPQPGGGLGGLGVGQGFHIFGGGVNGGGFRGGFPFPELGALIQHRPQADDQAMMAVLRGHGRRVTRDSRTLRSPTASPQAPSLSDPSGSFGGSVSKKEEEGQEVANEQKNDEDDDDDGSTCSSVSDDSVFDGEDDPRRDAFIPSSDGQFSSFGSDPPGVQLGLIPRRRPRYDYQSALEFRIFCLVRIMLNAFPRAACLMISDYTPLHSAVFHGRCPDTIRLLLDAEARFVKSSANNIDEKSEAKSSSSALHSSTSVKPCPILSGPAMLCTNTRGELPLHFACMRNECARSIRLLAQADPRAALVRDASGRTPLRWLWIRFVDGLLDRFGGRETGGEDSRIPPAFQEEETNNASANFPNPVRSHLGRSDGGLLLTDTFDGEHNDNGVNASLGEMFVFDTEYLRRTRNIDRTVDFLRMRHVPSSFENIEYVAAEHAITVLLKLKYLQQRRIRQLEAYESGSRSGDNVVLPADVTMSAKEEFILYAFEKFSFLIKASLQASEAEKRTAANDDEKSQDNNEEDGIALDAPSRKKLWHSLPHTDPNKRFFLVHEACRSSRSSCPAAVAKICIKLFSDQLLQCDDDGQLPLHKVAARGVGWEPPGALVDETLTLLKEVLSESHANASSTYDNNKQLPLHVAIDSLVTSLVMGKQRRASLHAEARVELQRHRHTHVEIAIECLSELLHANSSALQQRDGISRLLPFMQAALPHIQDCAVVKYTSDLSRRPGFDVGVGYSSMEAEVVEENDSEAESDHISIIYYLLREDPSVINCY